MKIVRLRPKGKRVVAEFDDGEPRLLAQDVVIKLGLFLGQELSDSELHRLDAEQEMFEALTIANRFLGYRARSEREVRTKLRQKNISAEAIDRTTELLRNGALLDDADFAMKFVHDALLKKPIGRVRLEQELRRKGVTTADIDSAIDLQFTLDDEIAAASRLIERRTQRTTDLTPFEQTFALKKYLQSRGFTREAIEAAVRDLHSTEAN